MYKHGNVKIIYGNNEIVTETQFVDAFLSEILPGEKYDATLTVQFPNSESTDAAIRRLNFSGKWTPVIHFNNSVFGNVAYYHIPNIPSSMIEVKIRDTSLKIRRITPHAVVAKLDTNYIISNEILGDLAKLRRFKCYDTKIQKIKTA